VHFGLIERKKILGWLIILISMVFWFVAIGSASSHGFFENSFAVQVMILGGAVSMIGGIFLWYEY
jgi:hypothetical protein